ncbi:cupin domain-containing protein [Methanothermobacter thermautotrophicus]|uniref:Cupin domain-containing protein n=2 Tax=Methanothermobacter thermautotrophicus TaxID=145262 RepID=A0A842YLZ3_METTF|nr:cupin domain-containing protein [Methanothermobacter thermautotrophicus]MBE2899977.1 cupin domain-containing protein [Methanothermobacter thermautotrophicus]MCQ8904780.1 cupin domain-containing protein [Methanothermobacter sp.]
MGMELRGKVIKISDLIDYQDDSVVSREIIRRETGTVTLFAFDRGQGLSEHIAPFDAMVQVIDGEAEVTISGERHRLVAGEMIIMPAGKPHAVMAVKPFRMLLTMIRS